MPGKRDHFVPQHYLRQFRFERTEQIAVALIAPFRLCGLGGINRQCQEGYFYEKDTALNNLLWQAETDIAPVLMNVTRSRDFDSKERVAMNLLAVILNTRTRRAVEEAKVYPKHIAYEVIKSAIETGQLPEPKGGWKEGMMDFSGVPGHLFQNTVLPCFMEMQTLECKLLEAPVGSFFITCDHPVVLLNQFCAHLEGNRSFVGFNRSGFQLVMPISPSLCLFFYDARVYRVGSRGRRLLQIGSEDVELINALQIQSADKCLYFHDPSLGQRVEQWVSRYAHLRTPIDDVLRRYRGFNQNEELLHVRAKAGRLPERWGFCGYKRHITGRVGGRRDPSWSHTINLLMADIDERPGEEDVFARLRRILGDDDTSPTALGSLRELDD
jgi:hypothetical protein